MLEDPPATDEVRRNDADVRSCSDRYTCDAGSNRPHGPEAAIARSPAKEVVVRQVPLSIAKTRRDEGTAEIDKAVPDSMRNKYFWLLTSITLGNWTVALLAIIAWFWLRGKPYDLNRRLV